jgi:hypothetical protein
MDGSRGEAMGAMSGARWRLTRWMRSRRALVSCAALLSLACFPFYGHDRRPVEHGSVAFRDAETAEQISEALVIPSVTKGFAFGFMRSHTDVLFAVGSADVCLAHPFVHRVGAGFEIPQPKTAAILFLLPPGVLGRVGGLEGALVTAPGYRSAYFDTWQLLEAYELKLRAVPSDASSAERSELKRVLESATLVGSETRWFRPDGADAPAESEEIDVCFSDGERDLVRAFLSQAPTGEPVATEAK